MVFLVGNCLDIMPTLPAQSVDMILADLPYGTTQNKWDSVLPFEPLWREYWRLLKPGGAVVLTAAQPFTSALVMSQVERFKYEWIWRKEKGTGHLNAKREPMRAHESVLIFASGSTFYVPQMTEGEPFGNKRGRNTSSYGEHGNFNNPNDAKYAALAMLRIARHAV